MMDNIIDDIRVELNGNRKYVFPSHLTRLVDVNASTEVKEIMYSHHYRISVTFSISGWCPPSSMEGVKQNFITGLKHELFGPFVRELHLLDRHLYGHDVEAAHTVLKDIIKKLDGK